MHLLSAECETPTSTDARLNHSQMYVLATPMKSLQAAAEIARQAGYHPVILGDALEGESALWPQKWPEQPKPARRKPRLFLVARQRLLSR